MCKGEKSLKIILVFMILTSLFTSSSAFASQLSTEKKAKDTKVDTVEVKFGDYIEKSAVKNLEWKYTVNDSLRIEEPQGTFVEYLVTSGQTVKEGDPLVAYNIPSDNIAVQENELQLKWNESDYQNNLKQREEEINKSYQKLSALEAGSIEAQILLLNIKKLEISLEQYKYQTNRNKDKLKETIKEQKADLELQYIYAPYDGMVFFRDDIKEGTILDPGMELIYIQDMSSAVLGSEITDIKKFWYHKNVTIEPIARMQVNTKNSYTGKIIAVDSLFNGKVSTGMIYISPDDTKELISSMRKANITVDSVMVKNVLLIPVKLVKSDEEMQYVYLLEDGVIRKQYITGRDNGSEMWVYNGLSEGQRIVVE